MKSFAMHFYSRSWLEADDGTCFYTLYDENIFFLNDEIICNAFL